MKNIIVPTDFSECSAAAYSYAASLAVNTTATIYLLHVLDIPVASMSGSNGRETTADTHFMMEMMKLTKSRMAKIRGHKAFKGVNVREVIEIGSAQPKIFEAAKKYKADIIIMGTHGLNGSRSAFIGTNAEKVVRDAKIPVLTIKDTVKNPRTRTILFATDFSKEAEYVLPQVRRISDAFNAKLILTKIVTPAQFESTAETEKQIEVFRRKNKIYNYSTRVYHAYDKEEGIRRVAEMVAADMIALGTHGRHGLARFFKGSIAEGVVNHASLPVLTLNFRKGGTEAKKGVQRAKQVRQYESDLLYQIPSI